MDRYIITLMKIAMHCLDGAQIIKIVMRLNSGLQERLKRVKKFSQNIAKTKKTNGFGSKQYFMKIYTVINYNYYCRGV